MRLPDVRRRVLASAVLLTAPLLGVPVASAEQAPELCTSDTSRGGVPEAFPVAACVDGTSMTLHNDRDRPVIVTGTGGFDGRVALRAQNSALADVVRRTSEAAMVLLPGEVVRWDIGSQPASLTVAPLPIPPAPEIAAVLRPALTGGRAVDAERALRATAGELVLEVAAAVRARTACVADRNFLQTAACDVTAATTIGLATVDRLDRRTAAEVLPQLIDRAAWAAWPAVDPDWPVDAEGTLRQGRAPVVAPAVRTLPAPAPAASPRPAPASRAPESRPAAPAPRPPAARPAPARTPAATPALPAAPAPEPQPVRPPVQAVPPAPAPPQVDRLPWQEIRERNLARLRELAAAWAKARERAQGDHRDRGRDGERDGDRGRGRGDD